MADSLEKTMQTVYCFLKASVGASLLCLLTNAAQAQVLLTLSQPVQSYTSGTVTVLNFNATVTNSGTSPVFLNGLSFELLGISGITTDDTGFFNNFANSYATNAGVTDQLLFSLTVDTSAPVGDFLGSVSLRGGANATADDVLVTQNFTLQGLPGATVAPEPATFALLGIGSLALGLVRRRK